MQLEDLQQPRICSVTIAISVARFRGSVPADAYVHDPDELCEGLGCGIPTTNGYLDSLLDRIAFKWATAVARQGTHTDGLAAATLFLDVLNPCILHPFIRERKRNVWIYRPLLCAARRRRHHLRRRRSVFFVAVCESFIHCSSFLEHCTVTHASSWSCARRCGQQRVKEHSGTTIAKFSAPDSAVPAVVFSNVVQCRSGRPRRECGPCRGAWNRKRGYHSKYILKLTPYYNIRRDRREETRRETRKDVEGRGILPRSRTYIARMCIATTAYKIYPGWS